MSTPKLKIKWQTAKLSEVLAFFANAYQPAPETFEAYVDTAKGEVVFKLFVEGVSDDR